MTKEKRNEIAKKLLTDCFEILNKKGIDYSSKEDALANFKRNAEKLGLTKYQIWAVYFGKHIDAIFNSIKRNPNNPQVESEPLDERIKDSMNYLALFKALLYEDTKD